MYPEYAEIKGKKYKIDTDFNIALQCFDIIEDDTIVEEERALAIIYLLFGFIPKNNDDLPLFLDKAKMYLQCGKTFEQQNNSKKDMDFKEDKSLIVSSFMSDYHIDLSKEKVHFWEFVDLLEGLTEGCSLNRVRYIRNYDLSEIKDSKEREKMKKAKQQVALKNIGTKKKLTKEEKTNVEDFFRQAGIKER